MTQPKTTAPARLHDKTRAPAAATPAARPRLAAIDLGSNTVRLFAVEMVDAVAWRILADTKATTRLGGGLADLGRLRPQAMRDTANAVAQALAAARDLRCDPIRICATAAVREAQNRREFESLLLDQTGEPLWVASMAEEGRLVHASAGRLFGFGFGSCMTIDLGGGSLEIVQSLDGVIIANASAPLGAVRLTEQFGGPEEAAGPRFQDMRRHIDEVLDATFTRPAHAPRIVAASGGSAVAVAALCHGPAPVEKNAKAPRRAAPVSRAELKELVGRLRGTTVQQRLAMPGMPEDRADIFPAAALVLHRVLRRLDLHAITPHDGGIREGVILDLLAARERAAIETPTPVEAVRRFARSCRYEEPHSEQVARLSVQLFDSLAAAGLFQHVADRDRELLEAAAVLHDVGCMVEYRRHHKHSHAITLNAQLPGFSDAERMVIAAVARYHRRAEPRAKHPEFAALSQADRERVRRLAGVLRVADGFDRTHAQEVRGLAASTSNSAVQITASLKGGASDLAAQELLRAASKKSGLLESVLGRPISLAVDRSRPRRS